MHEPHLTKGSKTDDPPPLCSGPPPPPIRSPLFPPQFKIMAQERYH